MNTIILYGMRGSGKTTIGKLLAEKLGYQFYDLDITIQEEACMSAFQFVKQNGWEVFREREHAALSRLLEKNGSKVISLGGGTMLSTENQMLIKKDKTATLIFIDCPLSEIENRILSDIKQGKERNPLSTNDVISELKDIYSERYPIYLSLHDYRISNVTTPDVTVDNIINDISTV